MNSTHPPERPEKMVGSRKSSKSRKAPLARGDWVTPKDPTHPMHNKRGRVESTEYVGCGLTDQFMIIVQFENVHPAQRKRWQFRHGDVNLTPAHDAAGSHRRNNP